MTARVCQRGCENFNISSQKLAVPRAPKHIFPLIFCLPQNYFFVKAWAISSRHAGQSYHSWLHTRTQNKRMGLAIIWKKKADWAQGTIYLIALFNRIRIVRNITDVVGRTRTKILVLYLKNHEEYLYYKQKVSFLHMIAKIWLSELDTEPKFGSEPGSTKPVSRCVLTLRIVDRVKNPVSTYNQHKMEWRQ